MEKQQNQTEQDIKKKYEQQGPANPFKDAEPASKQDPSSKEADASAEQQRKDALTERD
jgi:hypothetical protein